jgi:hypothetical protein
VRSWLHDTTDEIWIECGLEQKPSYKSVYRRLKELERVRDEFLAAAAAIIQRCKKHDKRVMSQVHFDWTEDSTAASLIHDCQKSDKCERKDAGKAQYRHLTRAATGEMRSPAKRSKKQPRRRKKSSSGAEAGSSSASESTAAGTERVT